MDLGELNRRRAFQIGTVRATESSDLARRLPDLLFNLLRCFVFGPSASMREIVRFSQCFTFSRNSSSDCWVTNGIALLIQRDVMAGNVVSPEFLRHEVIQQALMAGVRTRGVSMVRTGERILEDGCRAPRRAIPISIATLLDEIQLVAQNFQHVSLIFRHYGLRGSFGSVVSFLYA